MPNKEEDGPVNNALPPCPQCSSEYSYEMGALLVCPECAHEWTSHQGSQIVDRSIVVDSVGNELSDGDAVTVVKNLKVKGSPTGIKAGTKVRNIRLVDGADNHNIECKIAGIGSMQLKSEFVKKA
jgi:protein PhnA